MEACIHERRFPRGATQDQPHPAARFRRKLQPPGGHRFQTGTHPTQSRRHSLTPQRLLGGPQSQTPLTRLNHEQSRGIEAERRKSFHARLSGGIDQYNRSFPPGRQPGG